MRCSTFAGDSKQLLRSEDQKNRLTTLLNRLKEPAVRRISVRSRKELRKKRGELIKSLTKEDDSLSSVLKGLEGLFEELKGLLPQSESEKQHLCVSKNALEEWKHTIDLLL